MSSSQSTHRNKPSLVGAGLSEDARKAMNTAFDALSDWRNEIASVAERNGATVFDKMAAAAKAMGWPPEFVDMTRQQMQQTSKMQMQMMDQIMDIWEQQMKHPGSPMPIPGPAKDSLPAFPQFPGFTGGAGGSAQAFPGFDLTAMPANPMQFWMQASQMWQKSWQQAFGAWMDMQKSAMDASRGSRRS